MIPSKRPLVRTCRWKEREKKAKEEGRGGREKASKGRGKRESTKRRRREIILHITKQEYSSSVRGSWRETRDGERGRTENGKRETGMMIYIRLGCSDVMLSDFVLREADEKKVEVQS